MPLFVVRWGPAAVAVRDEKEQQAGLLARHGLEADLVDDEERGRHVLATAKSLRTAFGVPLEGGEEIFEAVEDHREARERVARRERREAERGPYASLLVEGDLVLEETGVRIATCSYERLRSRA